MEKEKTPYRERMFHRFALYGFLKNLKFYEPFMILYFLSLDFSYTTIGLLISIKMLSITILELPTGVYADAFGRKKSMILSFFAYIFSFLIFFSFQDFYIFALAMLFYALGDAFRTGTHKAMILEYLRIKGMEDKKVDYYGHTRAFSQLGSALNALLAAAIVFYTGNYRIVFLIAIIPYIIDILNVGTYPKELNGERCAQMRMSEQLKDTTSDFLLMFKNKKVLKGMLNSSLFDGSFEVAKGYLQPILQSFAISLPLLLCFVGEERIAVIVGITYFIIYILTAIASKNSAKIVERFKDLPGAINQTFLAGTLLILLAGIILCLSEIYYLKALSIVLLISLYILKNLRRPMNISYISDEISHKTMASGLSVESLLKTLTAAILAPIIGFFADVWGIGTALIIIGFLMIIFFPLCCRIVSYEKGSN